MHEKKFTNVTLTTVPNCPIKLLLEAAYSIGHVRYINILTWLRGFQVKLLYLVLFSLYLSLFWELRDKRNLKNLKFDPKASEPCLNIDISNVAYSTHWYFLLSVLLYWKMPGGELWLGYHGDLLTVRRLLPFSWLRV